MTLFEVPFKLLSQQKWSSFPCFSHGKGIFFNFGSLNSDLRIYAADTSEGNWRNLYLSKTENAKIFLILNPIKDYLVSLSIGQAVLRIYLILMQIRILDPHWKKMKPDPGYFFKIYWLFFNKAEFSNFLSYFFRLFLC